MNIANLKKDDTITEWLDNLNPVANTEYTYLQGMLAYVKYTKMTPQELKAEARKEIRSGVYPEDRKIKSYFIGYRKSMVTKGLADHSIKNRMMGVRSFYDSFEIDLPKIKSDRRKARTLEENDEVPTKEDLQAALKVCDPLERAVMLCGISSGLASNEIRNLRIKDFKKGYDNETGITTLKLRREKSGVSFVTFLSPEASRAVNDYLEYRDRETKAPTARRQRQLDKQKVVGDDGYLFILRQIDNEFLSTHDESLRQLTENAVQKLYRSISEKVRKNAKKGTYNVIRSHTMRKYFDSALHNAECDNFYIQFFEGHTLDDTRKAYFRADIDGMRDIYAKYIPYLTIEKALDISESEDFKRIKAEHADLIIEAERHRVERQEIQELRRELEEQKEAYRKAIENATSRQDDISAIVQAEVAKIQKSMFEGYDAPKTQGDKDILEMKKRALVDPEFRKEFKESVGFDILGDD